MDTDKAVKVWGGYSDDQCGLCGADFVDPRGEDRYQIAIQVNHSTMGGFFVEQKWIDVCKLCHFAQILSCEELHASAPVEYALN